MNIDLDGQIALVTGSSRNIGREIAVRLSEAGADVGITARTDREGCETTADRVAEAGGEPAVTLGDLAEEDDVERIVDDVRDELGPIDVLVNNASYRPLKPFLEVTPEEWQRVHDVDLRAMALLSQLVLPDMIDAGEGVILNVLGITVYSGMAEKTHVMANKAGIPGLTRGLAVEFGPEGIRSNAVCLGLIDTDRDTENYAMWEEYSGKVERMSALRRIGTPEECADVCCYLVSDRASLITGQVLHVNGGTFPTADISAI